MCPSGVSGYFGARLARSAARFLCARLRWVRVSVFFSSSSGTGGASLPSSVVRSVPAASISLSTTPVRLLSRVFSDSQLRSFSSSAV